MIKADKLTAGVAYYAHLNYFSLLGMPTIGIAMLDINLMLIWMPLLLWMANKVITFEWASRRLYVFMIRIKEEKSVG